MWPRPQASEQASDPFSAERKALIRRHKLTRALDIYGNTSATRRDLTGAWKLMEAIQGEPAYGDAQLL